MRLLMITQVLDPHDPLLSFTLDWVQQLAQHVDQLYILCLEKRVEDAALPANVKAWSTGKDRGYGRVRQLLSLQGHLLRLMPQVDAVFSHMVARYVNVAAPLAFAFRKPLYLWYTHRQVTSELRLATALCRYVFSAVQSSFPLETTKLRAVGHGIDTHFFKADPAQPLADPPLIVHVARLMPVKWHITLLQATRRLCDEGIPVQVELIGEVPPKQDPRYRAWLVEQIEQFGLTEQVRLLGAQTSDQVRQAYQQATAAVNLSPPGLFDKAALEAMLVSVPTVVCSPSFDPLLRDHTAHVRIASPQDVDGLVAALKWIIALTPDERRRLTLDIQRRVRTAHGLDGLMERLVELMSS